MLVQMSLMGFGKLASSAAKMAGVGALGAGLLGAGATLKGGNYIAKKTGIAGKVGHVGNNLLQRAGLGIATFGNSFGSPMLADGSTMSSGNPITRAVQSVGNSIRSYGINMSASAETRDRRYEGLGINKKISSGSNSIMKAGLGMMNPLNKIPFPRHTNSNPYLYRRNKL